MSTGSPATRTLTLSILVLLALIERDSIYVDVALGLAALGFIGTIALAKYVADDAPSRTLIGQGTPFAGLTITITGGDGADNQIYPDVIAVDGAATDGDLVQSAWGYQKGGSGGQAVSLCLPYKAMYLAFGLEGVSTGPDRQEIVRRSMAWLTA